MMRVNSFVWEDDVSVVIVSSKFPSASFELDFSILLSPSKISLEIKNMIIRLMQVMRMITKRIFKYFNYFVKKK